MQWLSIACSKLETGIGDLTAGGRTKKRVKCCSPKVSDAMAPASTVCRQEFSCCWDTSLLPVSPSPFLAWALATHFLIWSLFTLKSSSMNYQSDNCAGIFILEAWYMN